MSGGLTLAEGGARVEIDPALGAGLRRYDFAGRAVFRRFDASAPDPALGMAMNLLAPWSNRVSGGGFRFEGAFHPLAPTLPGEPCPIHGTAWREPWRVEAAGAAEARLSRVSEGPAPYAWRAEATYALRDGALSVALSVENRARRATPYGLGLHPWLPRGPGARLRARARRVQLQDDRRLPTETVPLGARPDWDFSRLRPLPEGWINNAFDGWDGAAEIAWPGLTLRIEASPELPVFLLYAPSAEAGFFCFEPASHVVDAHNLPPEAGSGLTRLEPGARLSAHVLFQPRAEAS